MYISILIKINNHRIGFLFFPFVKRFKNVVNCIETLLKPKSSSEGLTQLLGYLAQSIPLCGSDAERKRAFTAGGVCQITDVTLTIRQVQILHRMKKEVLTQFLVPYFCFKLWIPNQKEKEKVKIGNDLFGRKAYLWIPGKE